MSDLLNSTLGLVGEAGDAIDRFTGGRALRGTLAGKPRELASVIPFSDSLGLTNERDKTSGRDLTDQYGLTTKGDTSFGSHALGFGADMLLSPANLLGAYGAAKAAPTLAQGAVAAGKALSGLDLVEHVGSGIKALGNAAFKEVEGPGGELIHTLGSVSDDAAIRAAGHFGDEAGSLQFHDFDKNPINQGQRTLMKHHNNASKAVRYSEDPARAQFYATDRNARFRAHMGHGERPSYGGPPAESNLPDAVAGFMGDESGAARLHLPQGAAEEFAGRTDNPLGRLAAYSDAAGAKLHLPENYDDWRATFGPGQSSNSYAVYQPREKTIVPNTHDFGAQWTQDPAMAAEMKSAPPDYFSTGNRDHLGLHEIGHALHHAKHPGLGPSFFDRLESLVGFRPSEAKEIAGQLSRYGSTHTAEFVAEKFARDAVAHGTGGQLPNFPDLAERYQWLGGPEIPTRLRDQLTRFLGGERGSLKLGAADAAGATQPVAQAQQVAAADNPGRKVAETAVAEAARRFAGRNLGTLGRREGIDLAQKFMAVPDFPPTAEGLDQAHLYAAEIGEGVKAADYYFSPAYHKINKHLRDLGPEGAAKEIEALRDGRRPTHPTGSAGRGTHEVTAVQDVIDRLMGLLDHSRMPQAMDLYRGVDGPGMRQIEQLVGAPLDSPGAVGREFVDPSFLSTAYHKPTADAFAGLEPGYNRPDPGVTFSFPQVPAGKPASLMNASENEILFPPGRKIKITDNKNFPHLKAELYTLLAAIMGGRAAQHYDQG